MTGAEIHKQVMEALDYYGTLSEEMGHRKPALAALAPCIVLTPQERERVRAALTIHTSYTTEFSRNVRDEALALLTDEAGR